MTDVLDKILAFGSSFDWVTPLIDLTKDVTKEAETITVSRQMSVGTAKRKLKPYGIKPWGVKYGDDTFTIEVEADEAETVRQVLGI